MRAGKLTKRASLSAPVQEPDPDGQIVTSWQHKGTVWANVLPLRGSEAVMQARLVSKSPAILTIRASAETRAITSEWRAVIDAVIFDLKEDPRPSEDGAYFEMLVEA